MRTHDISQSGSIYRLRVSATARKARHLAAPPQGSQPPQQQRCGQPHSQYKRRHLCAHPCSVTMRSDHNPFMPKQTSLQVGVLITRCRCTLHSFSALHRHQVSSNSYIVNAVNGRRTPSSLGAPAKVGTGAGASTAAPS